MCGTPNLEIQLEQASDGSVSAKVQDRNDTLAKVLAKVDDFVMTYTGKDLEQAVVATVRKKIGMKIISAVSKKTRARVRDAEKAKTYDEIDWGKHIKDNTLHKLYISQLDLYLRNSGYSQAEIGKKGFLKDDKVEAIKKHFYQNTKPKVTSPSQGGKIQISFPPAAISAANSSSTIQVLPWGGTVFLSGVGLRNMINTCPIDNFLLIIYVFWKTNNAFNLELIHSAEPYASTLLKVFHLYDQGKFGDGKYCWLQQFVGRFDFVSHATVDVWGNEDGLFVSRMETVLHNTFHSQCSSPNCPRPMLQVHAKRIMLR